MNVTIQSAMGRPTGAEKIGLEDRVRLLEKRVAIVPDTRGLNEAFNRLAYRLDALGAPIPPFDLGEVPGPSILEAPFGEVEVASMVVALMHMVNDMRRDIGECRSMVAATRNMLDIASNRLQRGIDDISRRVAKLEQAQVERKT